MKNRNLLPIIFGFALFQVLTIIPCFAEETYTDKMVQDMFHDPKAHQSHQVMAHQREKLRNIMDGFLVGDLELVQRNAEELSDDMVDIVKSLPPDLQNNSESWKAMSTVVKEEQLMKEEVLKKDYKKAYNHYALIMGTCIQCHQVSRGWGKLEELKTETQNDKSNSETKNAELKAYVERKKTQLRE